MLAIVMITVRTRIYLRNLPRKEFYRIFLIKEDSKIGNLGRIQIYAKMRTARGKMKAKFFKIRSKANNARAYVHEGTFKAIPHL